MISKKYSNWEEAIKEVQEISHSLRQSIGGGAPLPHDLKYIYAENQSYYEGIEEDEFDDYLTDFLDTCGNAYFTGGGTGFTWEFLDDGDVVVTLRHASEWHPYSTLLARAWSHGYGGNLPFAYRTSDANRMLDAMKVRNALTLISSPDAPEIEAIVEAVKSKSLPELLVEFGQSAQARRDEPPFQTDSA